MVEMAHRLRRCRPPGPSRRGRTRSRPPWARATAGRGAWRRADRRRNGPPRAPRGSGPPREAHGEVDRRRIDLQRVAALGRDLSRPARRGCGLLGLPQGDERCAMVVEGDAQRAGVVTCLRDRLGLARRLDGLVKATLKPRGPRWHRRQGGPLGEFSSDGSSSDPRQGVERLAGAVEVPLEAGQPRHQDRRPARLAFMSSVSSAVAAAAPRGGARRRGLHPRRHARAGRMAGAATASASGRAPQLERAGAALPPRRARAWPQPLSGVHARRERLRRRRPRGGGRRSRTDRGAHVARAARRSRAWAIARCSSIRSPGSSSSCTASRSGASRNASPHRRPRPRGRRRSPRAGSRAAARPARRPRPAGRRRAGRRPRARAGAPGPRRAAARSAP